MTIYLCEDSPDGIFTAIYRAWEAGTSRTAVEIKAGQTMTLFADYEESETDYVLSRKVAESIRNKLSEDVYGEVYSASLAQDISKADKIYRFLIKAFRVGRDILSYLGDADVMNVFELSRSVGNEAHFFHEFLRFEERSNNVLTARMNPKANVIVYVAEHFADRIHNENWIILDTVRNLAAIHRAGVGYTLVFGMTEQRLEEYCGLSDDEEKFKKLWKRFFDTIAIEERTNPQLQRNNMPLRYRKYMTELN